MNSIYKNGDGVSRILPGMQIQGVMHSDGVLVVEGNIEGEVYVARLEIKESGTVSGSVSVNSLSCEGELNGYAVAREFGASRTAVHTGVIETGKLSMERGAMLDCITPKR